MKRNVGSLDRLGRLLVSFALLVFGSRNREKTIGTLAFIGGTDLLATVVIRRCPLNALFGIDTCG
ncbi:YgaP family membrane protein [Halalkalicoccus ordinarius]|uniref:YgaP family membrane protein n=1 Tax=Halalkalicoccus ordinarius TaxID=3116651 RepID=UPI00300F3501